MARIVFLAAQRRFTGGLAEIVVEASDFRGVAAGIARRFPDFPVDELNQCVVAIDGEIVRTPLLERLAEDSEVIFVPRIGAG